MGTLATFTLRVACLSAVGACESYSCLCHSLGLTACGQDIARDLSGLHGVKAPLKLNANPGAVKLAADVIWNVGKLRLVYLTKEYYSYEDK